MKKYHFKNTVHIQTDRVGKHHETWIPVGFQSYSENKENHIESYAYYSFDEVHELYEKGMTTENVYKDSDTKYKLNVRHLSAITAFNVINGLVFFHKHNREHENLVKYAKKKGIVSDTPRPVEMKAGVKTLDVLTENTYKISYTFLPEKVGLTEEERIESLRTNSIKKLMVGSIKRIGAAYYLTSEDGKDVKKLRCEMANIQYDEKTATVSFVVHREYITQNVLRTSLNQLDLQLYYFFNQEFEWFHHLDALKQCARDYGQFHWINEKHDDDKSTFKWYEK